MESHIGAFSNVAFKILLQANAEEGRVRLHIQQGLGSSTLYFLKPGYSRDPTVQQRESVTHVHEGPRHSSKAVRGDKRSVLDLI